MKRKWWIPFAQVRERAFKVLDRFFEENPKVLLDMKAELEVGTFTKR